MQYTQKSVGPLSVREDLKARESGTSNSEGRFIATKQLNLAAAALHAVSVAISESLESEETGSRSVKLLKCCKPVAGKEGVERKQNENFSSCKKSEEKPQIKRIEEGNKDSIYENHFQYIKSQANK